MNTFNKTILIGRVVRKPELSQLKGDVVMATFTLTNSTVKDGREEVQYHRVRAFGNCAKQCTEQLGPKDLVCVEGRLNWKKNGQLDSVIVERMTFLSKGKPRETTEC